MLESASSKSRPPNSACTGAEVEMVTPGGEVSFVTRIIDESVQIGTRVQWYSCMLGKLSSVREVIEILQARGLMDVESSQDGKRRGSANWAVKEFIQGQKTRRWAVAWSWGTLRASSVCHLSFLLSIFLTF
jgi:23S rRNA (adenine1618-N6)-methyltransferase